MGLEGEEQAGPGMGTEDVGWPPAEERSRLAP